MCKVVRRIGQLLQEAERERRRGTAVAAPGAQPLAVVCRSLARVVEGVEEKLGLWRMGVERHGYYY